jgi:hypothetical protein
MLNNVIQKTVVQMVINSSYPVEEWHGFMESLHVITGTAPSKRPQVPLGKSLPSLLA